MAVLATETFSGSTGAGWPAQWTTALSSGSSGGVVDQLSGQGRIASPSVDSSVFASAFLSGMSKTVDCEVDFDLTFLNVSIQQTFSVGLRTEAAPGEIGGAYPMNGYAVACSSTGVSFFKHVGGVRTDFGSEQAYSFVANSKYHLWCTIRGAVLEVRIAASGAARPLTPTRSFVDADVYELPGKVRFSLLNGTDGSSPTVYLDNVTVQGMVSGDGPTNTLFPTAVSTSGVTWSNATNAVGSGQGTYALLSATNTSANYMQLSGFGAQAEVGAQPGTLSSVKVSLRAYWTSPSRFSVVNMQLYSGSTAIGASVALSKPTVEGTWQEVVFTGANLPTWAQLADLQIRINAQRTGTITPQMYVDVVGIRINYLASVSATVGFNDEFSPSQLDPRWIVINNAQEEQLALTGSGLRFTHGSTFIDLVQGNQLAVRLVQYVTGNFDVSFAVDRGVSTQFEGLGMYVDNGSSQDSLAAFFYFDNLNSHRYVQRRSGGVSVGEGNNDTFTGAGYGRFQRLTLSGTTLTYYASSDGTNWTTEFTGAWSGGQAQRVGFMSMSDHFDTWDLDYFRVVGGAVAAVGSYKPGQFLPFFD